MPRSRPSITILVGVIAAASILVLAACAPEPEPAATETATAAPETPAPEPYAGPLHFVGDELDWFLLTADEIAATIPGSADIAEPDAALVQVSDGFGSVLQPEICTVFLTEASLGSIGARTVAWTGAAGDQQDGVLRVLQFADEAQARNRMDDYAAAAGACSDFSIDGQASSYAHTVVDDGDGVRAMAGSLRFQQEAGADDQWNTYFGIASVGNVLVEFWQPFAGEPTLDDAAAAELLSDRVAQARDRLVEELTATPPAAEEDMPDVDPAAPWAHWEIGFDGIGPLRVGEELDDVLAAAPGAEIVDTGIGESQLTSPEGSTRLTVTPEENGSAVAALRAGVIGLYGEAPPDGSVLPRAGGVGVGDPVASAVAAFPQGTAVRIVSAGLYSYEVATRDGRVILFHSDREVAEDGATIVGITAEDGTLRREYTFSGTL